MAKNAYTFAKRAKELAKKKKKEEKQQRKGLRASETDTSDGLPAYDEVTGQIILPSTSSDDAESDSNSEDTEKSTS